MSQHADILDERDASLKRPLAGSLALHFALIATAATFSWWGARNLTQWGVEHPLGGAVGVEAVDKIPLPNRSALPNLVANDTQTSVPQKPDKVEKRKLEREDPDAVPLNPKKKLRSVADDVAQMRKYVPVPARPNQVYSTTGPAASSPLYGQKGIGGVGIGDATVAGRGCGGYLELVKQRIQSRWDAQLVSHSIRSPVIVQLWLLRNGDVRSAEVIQASRSSEIDFAAKRAILESSPFQPFLPSCEGNDAKIEVRFEPKR